MRPRTVLREREKALFRRRSLELAREVATVTLQRVNDKATPSPAPPEDADDRSHWSRMLGLHPLVAFGMIAADMMLFGGEAASAGVGLLVTIPVALALAIPCVLLQRYSFKDPWGAALGKGLMVGVLTAIPFPIGSPITIAGGILGLRGLKPKARVALETRELPEIKTRMLPDAKK